MISYFRYNARVTEIGIRLYLEEYPVVRHTPKGVWIKVGEKWDYSQIPYVCSPKLKFVLNGSRKKHAHPSPEEALEGFIARKKRQIEILNTQLEETKQALAAAQEDPYERKSILHW